jgi:hypothetical protein
MTMTVLARGSPKQKFRRLHQLKVLRSQASRKKKSDKPVVWEEFGTEHKIHKHQFMVQSDHLGFLNGRGNSNITPAYAFTTFESERRVVGWVIMTLDEFKRWIDGTC